MTDKCDCDATGEHKCGDDCKCKAEGQKTLGVELVTVTIQKLESADEPQVLTLAPNRFNVLMALLNFRDEHKAELDSYVMTCNAVKDACGRTYPMKVDALIAEYEKTTLGFDEIQAVLGDAINFLMLHSSLGAISVSACFLHPANGPTGVTLSTKNTFIDNEEVVGACEAVTVKACATYVQKYVTEKKAGKSKLIVPDKNIIVPGQVSSNPTGNIII